MIVKCAECELEWTPLFGNTFPLFDAAGMNLKQNRKMIADGSDLTLVIRRTNRSKDCG